jgi:hypothetical protein
MKETIIKCDGCGIAVKVTPYRIECGKYIDASGNGYDFNWDYKDFCMACLLKWAINNPECIEKIQPI